MLSNKSSDIRKKIIDLAIHTGEGRLGTDFSVVEIIDAIYSTNYNRTIETILPISISKGIKPIIYSPSNINYDSFLKKVKGKIILVVGHSNTIPGFVNELIEEDYYEQINDTVNSNLYIVKKCPEEINHNVIQIHSLQQ